VCNVISEKPVKKLYKKFPLCPGLTGGWGMGAMKKKNENFHWNIKEIVCI
jgi:hypothetical protein